MSRRLAVYGALSLALYLCLYIFHWAVPPFDAGIHHQLSERLHLGSLPGAAFLASGLRSRSIAAISFSAIICLLFLFYLLSLRLVRHATQGVFRKTIVLFIVIFATVNLLFYPWLSADIFHYGFVGKAVRVHQANPFTQTVRSLGERDYGRILYWQDTTIPYGPVAVLLYAAIYTPQGRIGQNAWSAKLLALAFFYGTIIVVGSWLRRRAPSRLDYALVLMGWNPLVLIESVANAHNDIILAFFLALSFYFALRSRFTLALITLMASALTKYITLMLLPLFAAHAILRDAPPRKKIADALLGLGGGLLLAILCYLPFWEGWHMLNWVGSHIGLSGRSFHYMLTQTWAFYGWPTRLIPFLFGAALLLYALALSSQCRTPTDLSRNATRLVLFYLIFCCFFNHPWYLLWAVPLVALAESRDCDTLFNVCCVCSFLGYYPLLYLTRCEGPGTVWVMSVITVVPPALAFIYYAVRPRR